MSDQLDFARMIGERVCHARLAAGWSQAQLADKLGFNDRQTVSTIESGKRALTAEELVHLTQVLKQPLDFFTDPYLLVEKGEFSYRTTRQQETLATFEQSAQTLLAANHRFRELLKESPSPVVGELRDFTVQSTSEQAEQTGHKLSQAWGLGDRPAEKLGETLESKLHVMVLYVDAPEGVSGAACRLNQGDAVLINRSEPTYRQNWTLGHELFHLLTWRAMPPKRIDPELKDAEKPKPEKLADAFTAGLLMPLGAVCKAWENTQGVIHQRILKAAEELQVSGVAMFYRLKNLGLLPAEEAKAVELAKLTKKKVAQAPKRVLYSREFVRRLHGVLDRGLVSVRLACDLLECGQDDLKNLFADHGLGVPFDL